MQNSASLFSICIAICIRPWGNEAWGLGRFCDAEAMQKRCRCDADQEGALHRSSASYLHRFRCRSSDADEAAICIAAICIAICIDFDAEAAMQMLAAIICITTTICIAICIQIAMQIAMQTAYDAMQTTCTRVKQKSAYAKQLVRFALFVFLIFKYVYVSEKERQESF